MVVRLIGGILATALLGAGALFYGFKGYQAYLRWLVAGQGPGTEPERQHDASADARIASHGVPLRDPRRRRDMRRIGAGRVAEMGVTDAEPFQREALITLFDREFV